MATLQDLMYSFFGKGSSSSPLAVTSSAPVAANILNGFQSVTVSTGATTLVTIPAGRTWVGKIGASVDCAIAAASTTAGQATADFTVAGAGATPAAGSLFSVEARAGANAATGTVGSEGNNFGQTDVVVIAPGGNAVTIQVTTTVLSTSGRCASFAIGQLL